MSWLLSLGMGNGPTAHSSITLMSGLIRVGRVYDGLSRDKQARVREQARLISCEAAQANAEGKPATRAAPPRVRCKGLGRQWAQ